MKVAAGQKNRTVTTWAAVERSPWLLFWADALVAAGLAEHAVVDDLAGATLTFKPSPAGKRKAPKSVDIWTKADTTFIVHSAFCIRGSQMGYSYFVGKNLDDVDVMVNLAQARFIKRSVAADNQTEFHMSEGDVIVLKTNWTEVHDRMRDSALR